MSWFYRHLVRPILFSQDSEKIHDRTLRLLGSASQNRNALKILSSLFGGPSKPVKTLGLTFPNPIGLAAGMDKNAAALPVWEALGFGFVELGGITRHAQPGNPQPRMFRCVPDEALVNRMGFNNIGSEAFAARLAEWKRSGLWPQHPVGVNLGKSKITPLEQAAEDYAKTFRLLWPFADFFVVNVSSPNTPNLRQLQDKAALDEILVQLHRTQQKLLDTHNGSVPAYERKQAKPILVKIAPDLTFEAIDEILELVEPRSISGIVATNTTISRPANDRSSCAKIYTETGGLSGRPLANRSTEVVGYLSKRTNGKLPIIGVGGIFSGDDAKQKFDAGACLVQLYTGLVFEGPSIVKEMLQSLPNVPSPCPSPI